MKLYLALRSGHQLTVDQLAVDDVRGLLRKVEAHFGGSESHPTLRLPDHSLVRTEAIVLCRAFDDDASRSFTSYDEAAAAASRGSV